MEKYSKFKRYGNEIRFNYCPICGKEKDNPDFSVNLETGQYYCFTTGTGGSIKEIEGFDLKMLNTLKPIKVKNKEKKDFNDLVFTLEPLNDVWKEYLKSRCISSTNAGIDKTMRINKYNVLTIPISDGKKPIAIKYRTMDKRISSEKGSQSDYFINWHNIKDKEYLIIVEGEIDLLSSIEVGFNNVVSLPFGAQNLKCIDNQLTWIAQFKKIIIAVDNDEQGEKSKQGIIQKLSNIKNKVYSVDLGEFKDFNEVLTGGGAETLKNIISGAEKVKYDIAFAPSFFGEKGKFLFDVFARYLKERFNIIKIDDELHCYSEGVYTKGDNLEKSMIELIPNLKNGQRTEVLRYLNIICEKKEKNTSGLIAFNNGIYNVFTEELMEFNPKYIITNKIPWDYNPVAYSELIDNTLNEFACNDTGIKLLIDELIGYILFDKNELGKSFIITGDKANGKSTFLKILIYMVGKDNYSALSLDDIVNSKFRVYQVVGKLLNIGDDIGNGYIPEAEILRKLITGDVVTAEQKGRDPIEFNCYVKFVFSANDIPRIKDPTGATARRIIIIPFRNKFDINNANYDPYFLDKVKTKECMEYLIIIGLIGLKRVLKNKRFSETEDTQKLLDEFNKNNNTILEYIDYLENEFFRNITLDQLITNYLCMKILNGVYEFPDTQDQLIGFNQWAIENGYQKVSIQTFKNNMCNQFNLEVKRIVRDGKKERFFIEK